jgi:hypothetical protein
VWQMATVPKQNTLPISGDWIAVNATSPHNVLT